jgi:hypothetical protein
MSKTLEATCAANIVKVDGLPVTPCTILSEGVSASTGVLLLDKEKAVYIPKITPDLKTAITELSALIDNLSSTMTSIMGCFTALDALPTISGACASFTAAILALQTTLLALKAQNETLKAAMK